MCWPLLLCDRLHSISRHRSRSAWLHCGSRRLCRRLVHQLTRHTVAEVRRLASRLLRFRARIRTRPQLLRHAVEDTRRRVLVVGWRPQRLKFQCGVVRRMRKVTLLSARILP